MQHETKPESAGAKRTLAGSAVGYGIVCGLTFPLMISSTFLQEMSLSHGAGDAFGALFFLAYALTMAGTALAYALRRKPTRRARIVSAFAAPSWATPSCSRGWWGSSRAAGRTPSPPRA